eukprot:55234-Eustigmatos_ZCMA.PRE.1
MAMWYRSLEGLTPLSRSPTSTQQRRPRVLIVNRSAAARQCHGISTPCGSTTRSSGTGSGAHHD